MNSKIALAASSLGSSSICTSDYIFEQSNLNAYLVVLIQPEEGQVCDPYGLPVILNLSTRAIDNVGDLVSDDELQVLHATKVIYNKQLTVEASSSPMKSPSLILIAPIISGSKNYCCPGGPICPGPWAI